MTIARKELVDVSVTRWYHCVTRCVRRAFLLGEGLLDRKQCVEARLQELGIQTPMKLSRAIGQRSDSGTSEML